MVRLFVRHKVEDYDAWRKAYDEFDSVRRPMGVTGDAVFRGVEDSTDITVWHDFDGEEAARAFTSSDELRSAIERAGVRGEPEVWLVSPA
jgi:hypothetical protein